MTRRHPERTEQAEIVKRQLSAEDAAALAQRKPKFTEPCNGCGFCCASSVCEVGLKLHGNTQAPCQLMRWREGRFFCGAIDIADEMGVIEGFALRVKLAIGFGCDSETDEEWDVREAAKI